MSTLKRARSEEQEIPEEPEWMEEEEGQEMGEEGGAKKMRMDGE